MWTPLRILTTVDLPQPFSPTSAWTSPARSSKDASRTACVGPNAFATLATRSSVVRSRSPDGSAGIPSPRCSVPAAFTEPAPSADSTPSASAHKRVDATPVLAPPRAAGRSASNRLGSPAPDTKSYLIPVYNLQPPALVYDVTTRCKVGNCARAEVGRLADDDTPTATTAIDSAFERPLHRSEHLPHRSRPFAVWRRRSYYISFTDLSHTPVADQRRRIRSRSRVRA